MIASEDDMLYITKRKFIDNKLAMLANQIAHLLDFNFYFKNIKIP